MITGLFTIIGVILGFYLGKYKEINKQVIETTHKIAEKRKKHYGEPFVTVTDEVLLEQQQERKKEKEEDDFILSKDAKNPETN